MTNQLTTGDYQILLDLAKGSIPKGNSDKYGVLHGVPIYIEELKIDSARVEEYLRKEVKRIKFRPTLKWEEESPIYDENNDVLELYIKPLQNPIKMYAPLSSVVLTEDDFKEALESLSEPATAKNRFKVAFGKMIFEKMAVVKGYTFGPNSKAAYVEENGKLYPTHVGVYDVTPETLERERQVIFDKLMDSFHKFETHCQGISSGQEFESLEFICKRIDFNEDKEWPFTSHFTSYSDVCRGNLDKQKRIVNPISGGFSLFESGSRGFGYVTIRPILSNGELATPETIKKYLNH